MKRIFLMTAVTIMVVAGFAGQVRAEASKDAIASSLLKEQKDAEADLVRLWLNNRRGKEMEELLGDYVVREVRLRVMSGRTNTGTLLSSVNGSFSTTNMNPISLGKAIVLEHFKRLGVDMSDDCFVKGEYLFRASCLDNPPPSFSNLLK